MDSAAKVIVARRKRPTNPTATLICVLPLNDTFGSHVILSEAKNLLPRTTRRSSPSTPDLPTRSGRFSWLATNPTATLICVLPLNDTFGSHVILSEAKNHLRCTNRRASPSTPDF